jgi:hypothetical protein
MDEIIGLASMVVIIEKCPHTKCQFSKESSYICPLPHLAIFT